MAGTGLSIFMTAPWQLFLTWGLMVGIGSGAGAVGMAAAIANRWFARRTGFAMGLLTAANAAGQLIFLPLLAMLAEHYGWRGVAICVTLAVAVVLPIVAILLPESPARIGLGPYGSTAMQQPGADHAAGGNPFAVAINALRPRLAVDGFLAAVRDASAICGFSTNGLINTHLIAYCADHGIAEVNGASILAVIGVFSLIGSAAIGLDVRPVQSARAAVLVLRAARAVAGDRPVHLVRSRSACRCSRYFTVSTGWRPGLPPSR